jgi:hypothetical protein
MSDSPQEEAGTSSQDKRLMKLCMFCGHPVHCSERAESFPEKVWIHKGCEAGANRAMEEVLEQLIAEGMIEAAGINPQGNKIYKSLIHKSGNR